MQPMPSAEPDRQRSTPSPTRNTLLTHADDAVCSSTQGQCDRFRAATGTANTADDTTNVAASTSAASHTDAAADAVCSSTQGQAIDSGPPPSSKPTSESLPPLQPPLTLMQQPMPSAAAHRGSAIASTPPPTPKPSPPSLPPLQPPLTLMQPMPSAAAHRCAVRSLRRHHRHRSRHHHRHCLHFSRLSR